MRKRKKELEQKQEQKAKIFIKQNERIKQASGQKSYKVSQK